MNCVSDGFRFVVLPGQLGRLVLCQLKPLRVQERGEGTVHFLQRSPSLLAIIQKRSFLDAPPGTPLWREHGKRVNPAALPLADAAMPRRGRVDGCRRGDRSGSLICHRARHRLPPIPLLAATMGVPTRLALLIAGIGIGAAFRCRRRADARHAKLQ